MKNSITDISSSFYRTFLGFVIFFFIHNISYSEIVPIITTGTDDGIQTNKKKDRNEAVMNAIKKAVEQAEVDKQVKSSVLDGIINYQLLTSKIKSILLPGYKIHDMGYNDCGVYQVVLIGKYIKNELSTGIPKGDFFYGIPEEGKIKMLTSIQKDELEKELSTTNINQEVKEEIRKLPIENTFLAKSNTRYEQQQIDIINNYVLMRYNNNVIIIEKKNYKIRYIVSGLKNEILDSLNKWERIQLDFYIINNNKFLLYVDAFYATGLGNKEPPLAGYIDMEQKHYKELSYYAKELRYEIEDYFQKYEEYEKFKKYFQNYEQE